MRRVKRGGERLWLVYNGVLSDARLAVGIRFVEKDIAKFARKLMVVG